MTNKFKDKIVLITGASRGIGAETAFLFAKEGAVVLVTDISLESGNKVVEAITNEKGNAIFIKLDVANEQDWINVFTEIEQKYNRLDILVNNAGISMAKPVTEMSLSEWRNIMAINLDGVFLGTKYAIKMMEKSGSGRIINVSSASGIVGSPTASAYCASKAGVRLFTKSVALECAKKNILINSVCPAGVETPIWENSDWWPDFVKQMGSHEAALQALSQGSPIGRMAKAEEIAKGILFLAGNDSTYITGTELVIDGGYTAQ